MTQREQRLLKILLGLCGVLLVGGGTMLTLHLLRNINQKHALIAKSQRDVMANQAKLTTLQRQQYKLEMCATSG
jgi:hypothetical protein